MDRDGSKLGYDLKLIKRVCDAVKIPVIACGGVKLPKDFFDGFVKGGASACAAGNFFHITEHSPIIVKSYLVNKRVDIRLHNHANYNHFCPGRELAERHTKIRAGCHRLGCVSCGSPEFFDYSICGFSYRKIFAKGRKNCKKVSCCD